MLSIDVPTQAPNVSQPLTLSGITYEFVYTYNSTIDRLYISIYLNDELVIGGLQLTENGFLLDNYNIPEFNHGDLYCARITGDSSVRATLGTIGIDKEYEFIYITNSELQELEEGFLNG